MIRHYGVDVSEHNGIIDWREVRDAGIEFAIIRLGYGRGHLDSRFYENVNGAINAGLSIGVYYYSYANNCHDAQAEAAFATHILTDCGIIPAKLAMGLWYDVEEALIGIRSKLPIVAVPLSILRGKPVTLMPAYMPIWIGGPIISTVRSWPVLNGVLSIIELAIFHRLTCGSIPIH